MNMDFSDSLCANILRASASASAPLIVDPVNASIISNQFQNVKDQRVAMAAKIQAKFRVAAGDTQAPATTDSKIFARKFVTFDASNFVAERQLSLRDYYEASYDLKKMAHMIRGVIHNDFSLAHADNVCKLHQQFDRREGGELQALCLAGSAHDCENFNEEAPLPAIFEEFGKIIVFDFDAQKATCDDACNLHAQAMCAVFDEPPDQDSDDWLHESESIFKIQFGINRNFRLSEANCASIVDCDFCTPVDAPEIVDRLICASNLEYSPHDDSVQSCCLLANTSGFCASILMQTVQEHSCVVDLPTQPILLCVEYGNQNYPCLVATCTPSNSAIDCPEDFSLPVLEAFPFEPLAAVTVRSFIYKFSHAS